MPRQVWVLATIAFCVSVGFGVMIPVLPVFAREFGVSNFMVGLVVSSFAFVRLVTAPTLPAFARRVGERWLLGVGMFVVAISSALMGLATNYWSMLLWRALGGVGSAMFTVSAMVMLLRSVDASRRGRAAALYQGGFLLGGMSGPALGGLLAKISLTAPFFFYAATLTVAGVVGLALLERDRRVGREELKVDPPAMREVVKDRRYQAAVWANFAQGWQSFGVRSSLVPVLVTESLHHSPTMTGTVFAVAAVAQTAVLHPVGRLVDTMGRRPMMIWAGVLCAAATLAIPLCPSIWWLMAVMCVYAFGAAMYGTAPAAAVGDVVGKQGGQPVAIFTMTSDVGAIAGPLVAGWLADSRGLVPAFAIGALWMALGAAWAMLMPKEENPKEATGAEAAA